MLTGVQKKYSGGNLMWHGDEASNPYSDGFDIRDRPVFLFLIVVILFKLTIMSNCLSFMICSKIVDISLNMRRD